MLHACIYMDDLQIKHEKALDLRPAPLVLQCVLALSARATWMVQSSPQCDLVVLSCRAPNSPAANDQRLTQHDVSYPQFP